MKFSKGDIIIPVQNAYPDGALTVDEYESDGTLLAHQLGGGFQCRFNPLSQSKFKVVPNNQLTETVWRRTKFCIEGIDGFFIGWSNGRLWNGWAMPVFEFTEATNITNAVQDFKNRFDGKNDCFITTNGDDEDEIWSSQTISVHGGTPLKVYGIGAGSWIWEEINDPL